MNRTQQGFTLIELMTVVIIMAITIAWGIPAFSDLIERTSTRSAAESIVESFRAARLTAVQQKKRIVLCSTNDGASCGATWDDGFLVFEDTNENRSLDAGEAVLHHETFKDSLLVKVGSNTQYKIYIDSNGWTPGSADSLLVCAKPGERDNGYRIVINRAGKIRIEDSTVAWVNAAAETLNCDA